MSLPELHHACIYGHYNKIKALLADGSNPNLKYNDLTPLHITTYHSDLESSQALLMAGANPKINSWSPKMIAIMRKFKRCIHINQTENMIALLEQYQTGRAISYNSK